MSRRNRLLLVCRLGRNHTGRKRTRRGPKLAELRAETTGKDAATHHRRPTATTTLQRRQHFLSSGPTVWFPPYLLSFIASTGFFLCFIMSSLFD
ncbi:hypothetical protein RvY_07103-2 [Ramazzottius varieornatus]|uniref:Transmembrane protein n=1 Tax=Ramazzottius varieornatus TaxID=947166 RepID=A0A1D1V0W1_RAMVA|nr:hypothetical protein RvY_07103-2 [Ramazzottius varieornatus]